MLALRSLLALALTVNACRTYDDYSGLADQHGLLPADQFASYGREQAIMVAIGRHFARPYNVGLGKQAEIAVIYAKKFPDVIDVQADTLGHRLTVRFKSGWRVGIVPIDDGKSGNDTKIPS